MSRFTPPAGSLSKGSGGTKATTPLDASGLFQTLQGHVDDIRGLIQCGICIRPLYEPFTLACGHTFCYGCLSSWFAEGRSNKTCPDCRAAVKSQPAPAYLVRAVVQLFTSRPELLDNGETTDQHRAHQLEEAEKLEADKKNTNSGQAGLFRGIFNKTRFHPAQPIVDVDDGVVRCPQCAWEMEETWCGRCGFGHDDDSMSGTDWRSDSEMNSEMTDDPYDEEDEEIEDGFGHPVGFDWGEWYDEHDGLPLEALPPGFRHNPAFGMMTGAPVFYGDFDSHDSHDEDENEDEDEDDDEDMDSFIDDGEPSENFASESDRSTIVGHPGYSREELQALFEASPSSGYSTAHSNVYDFTAVPDSGDDEEETEHERHNIVDIDTSDTSDDSEDEDEDTMDSDDDEVDDDEDDEDDEGDDDDDDDDDDDEGPIRPAVAASRRRGPPFHVLSSSSPGRPNGGIALNPTVNGASPHTRRVLQPEPAGSTATRAISLDDDDSDEGPVAPTRRRGVGRT
ncbi:hypothetical protein BJY04DRAFT_110144 [Aspergillus karnatakaensis]|uniref:uncharacterized protein n=1 Tax=Aspergillus karnatakaensis TaxID=1810916 RepID=UPI003CCDC1C3